jgi:hypothetical protein
LAWQNFEQLTPTIAMRPAVNEEEEEEEQG